MVVLPNTVATRKVNNDNPALRQELQSGRRQIEHPDQIYFLRFIFAEIVANPTDPLEKIGIIPRKSD